MKLSRERMNAATTLAYGRTVGALRSECDNAACAALCRGANESFDAELAAVKRAGVAVACKPGCDYCCHLRVEVFAHEAAALLDALRTRIAPAVAADIERRIDANAKRVDAMSSDQHRAAGIACAFLVDARCSAHEARPSACAAYHSLSRERCAYAFHHPEEIGTSRGARPASLELQVFGAAVIEATQAACRDAGRATEQAELHQALRALLSAERPR